MRFVAADTFKVKLGSEDKWEAHWQEKQLQLEGSSGFISFMLLRGADDFDETEEGGGLARDGYARYEAQSVWMHRMDFDDWRSQAGSPDAKRGHTAVLSDVIKSLLLEPPQSQLFESALIVPAPAEESGGLFEWEDNASYFDGDLYE